MKLLCWIFGHKARIVRCDEDQYDYRICLRCRKILNIVSR